jgi:hypothetical protein
MHTYHITYSTPDRGKLMKASNHLQLTKKWGLTSKLASVYHKSAKGRKMYIGYFDDKGMLIKPN